MMEELEKILAECLDRNEGSNVLVETKIPKISIRIDDSRTMMMYGMGIGEEELGFSLTVFVEKSSNKGKKINEELTKGELLENFKVFEDKRNKVYVQDFRRDVQSIALKVQHILDTLKTFALSDSVNLTAYRRSNFHTLDDSFTSEESL